MADGSCTMDVLDDCSARVESGDKIMLSCEQCTEQLGICVITQGGIKELPIIWSTTKASCNEIVARSNENSELITVEQPAIFISPNQIPDNTDVLELVERLRDHIYDAESGDWFCAVRGEDHCIPVTDRMECLSERRGYAFGTAAYCDYVHSGTPGVHMLPAGLLESE